MDKDFTRGVIAILSVIGIISIAGGMFYYTVPAGSKDFFLIILTFLVAKIGTVYDFFFGSSQSSSDKNNIISNLTAPVLGTTTVTTVKAP